jgi:hypothetical protein
MAAEASKSDANAPGYEMVVSSGEESSEEEIEEVIGSELLLKKKVVKGMDEVRRCLFVFFSPSDQLTHPFCRIFSKSVKSPEKKSPKDQRCGQLLDLPMKRTSLAEVGVEVGVLVRRLESNKMAMNPAQTVRAMPRTAAGLRRSRRKNTTRRNTRRKRRRNTRRRAKSTRRRRR